MILFVRLNLKNTEYKYTIISKKAQWSINMHLVYRNHLLVFHTFQIHCIWRRTRPRMSRILSSGPFNLDTTRFDCIIKLINSNIGRHNRPRMSQTSDELNTFVWPFNFDTTRFDCIIKLINNSAAINFYLSQTWICILNMCIKCSLLIYIPLIRIKTVTRGKVCPRS